MLQKMKNLVLGEEGQAVTEYGLIIGLIAVGCIAIFAAMGTELERIFGWIKTQLQGVTG